MPKQFGMELTSTEAGALQLEKNTVTPSVVLTFKALPLSSLSLAATLAQGIICLLGWLFSQLLLPARAEDSCNASSRGWKGQTAS